MMSLPTFYSLRRCPYAMRARMGLLLAEQPVMLRDIVTRNKPHELLEASPKGTVPVVILDNGEVIEQSLDIMLWALSINDPYNLLHLEGPLASEIIELINHSDTNFIPLLEQYRASARYHNDDLEQRRNRCEELITLLEERLQKNKFLFGEVPCLADFALMPFVSQFSRVEKKWFVQSKYSGVALWLKNHYESALYTRIMKQYPQWVESQQEFLFK